MTNPMWLEQNDPRMKLIKPKTYVWFDNGEDCKMWVVKDEAEYIFEESDQQ